MNKLMKRMMTVLLLVLILAGCGVPVNKVTSPETSRFIQLEKTNKWLIVADKETGVMYSVSNGGYNSGTFTLLVDEEGKPLIWEGDDDEGLD